jgi:mono/diheme cytochrome c family protein
MRLMKFISLAIILMIISTFAAAQAAPAENQATVRHVPITNTSATSGKEMFESYCAVCHGKDAKGDGPAASALKVPPSDLTLLTQKNSGKFPSAHVSTVIRGQAGLTSHGSQDMPIWGPLFSSISQGHQAEVQQRIANLTSYIEKLQAK